MDFELTATQCTRTGTVKVEGTVFTPIAGYMVDTLSMSFSTHEGTAALVMDMFAPSGGGLRSITGKCANPVKVCETFNADETVSMLRLYMNGESYELPVTQETA